jgi:predicted transposase/invertase (TIGR01784 family)
MGVLRFLKSILTIPKEEYQSITVINPFLKRTHKKDKEGQVDVRVKMKSGRIVHVEIQVYKTKAMDKRMMYYISKLFTEQIGIGEKWENIQPVVSILICDHVLLKDEKAYLNRFELRNTETNKPFTDLLELIILELPKAPEKDDGNAVWPWLRFLKTENMAEMVQLAKQYEEVKMAVVTVERMNPIKSIRWYLEERAIYRRDREAQMDTCFNDGKEEGATQRAQDMARRMKARNKPLEEIVEFTGLTKEDVEKL